MLAQEDVNIKKHYLLNLDDPLQFSKSFDTLLFSEVNLEDGKFFGRRKHGADITFLGLFNEEISSSMCLFTDGLCIEYVGFAVVSYDESIRRIYGIGVRVLLFILCRSNDNTHGSGIRI